MRVGVSAVTEHLDINPRYREIHKSAADEIAAFHSEPETSSHSSLVASCPKIVPQMRLELFTTRNRDCQLRNPQCRSPFRLVFHHSKLIDIVEKVHWV